MTRDLLFGAQVKDLVREAYRRVPPTTAVVAHQLYRADELAGVPAAAVDRALGVANHLRHAAIQPGDTVLDLGCGGGIDTVLAARRTGPSGQVIALDFLPEMLARTADAARQAGLDNVRTVEGELEAIPLPDDSVDLVISNGVVNLSPRKTRTLAEAARVLRPGGRFCVADLTVEQDGLPSEILIQPAAWAGCVAGALAEQDFVRKLARVGFTDIGVVERRPLSIDDCALYPLFTPELLALMRELIPPQQQDAVAVAAVFTAVLPGRTSPDS